MISALEPLLLAAGPPRPTLFCNYHCTAHLSQQGFDNRGMFQFGSHRFLIANQLVSISHRITWRMVSHLMASMERCLMSESGAYEFS